MEDYPGMNFAVIEGAHVYHTMEDNYDTFNRGSALHYLDTVSELTRYFATEETLSLDSDDFAVHFPFLPGRLLVIPQKTEDALAALSLILFVLMACLMIVREKVRIPVLLLTMLIQAVFVAVPVLGGSLLADMLYGIHLNADWVLLGLVLILGLLNLYALRALNYKYGSPASIAMGVLAIPALLAVVITYVFPAANYLFFIPVLLGMLALLPACFEANLGLAFGGLVTVVNCLLYVPIALLVYVAMGAGMAFASLSLALLLLNLIFGLYFGTLANKKGQVALPQ